MSYGLGGAGSSAPESNYGGKTRPEFASITPHPQSGSKATLCSLGGDTVAICDNNTAAQWAPAVARFDYAEIPIRNSPHRPLGFWRESCILV